MQMSAYRTSLIAQELGAELSDAAGEIYHPLLPAGQQHGSPIMVIFHQKRFLGSLYQPALSVALHLEACLCLPPRNRLSP